MTGVRFRHDTGFEMKCPDCRQFWPLDVEFWKLRNFARCRACHNDRGRVSDAAYYQRHRDERLAAQVRRRQRDNESKRRSRFDPERRPLVLARGRETQRRYYERKRTEILAARRAQYEARVGHPPTAGIGAPRLEVRSKLRAEIAACREVA